MISFRIFCEARDFGYLSIGHNFDGKYDSWALKRKANDILIASKEGKDAEHFHDDYQRGLDFKGRIDHDKKMVSIVNGGWGDETRLEYVKSLLEKEYPSYEIWLFGGIPKRIK